MKQVCGVEGKHSGYILPVTGGDIATYSCKRGKEARMQGKYCLLFLELPDAMMVEAI